jgi:NAD(P)-dependent dehydrogenase (short-subunit alcohol dehydrogenase family)
MSQEPIVVVSGANRGIGLEICRQLARRGARVILTARDPRAGEQAARRLQSEGLKAPFHPLDVTDDDSARRLRDHLESDYGRLDVLINNAGVFRPDDAGASNVSLEAIRATMEVNSFGALRMIQALLPLLRKSPQGRIINMSSGMGQLADMFGGDAAYRLSKTCLNAVTATLAHELKDTPILVNSMCPGWVKTDMGGAEATHPVEQGADTAVWLALDAPPTLRGKFVRDRQVIPW